MDAEEKRARDLVRQRADGCCELCGRQGSNFHHRKNRSQGGGYSAENGLLLCGSGTTGCHGYVTEHPARSYENGWMVRRSFDPSLVPVKLFGQWFFLLADGNTVMVDDVDIPEG